MEKFFPVLLVTPKGREFEPLRDQPQTARDVLDMNLVGGHAVVKPPSERPGGLVTGPDAERIFEMIEGLQ